MTLAERQAALVAALVAGAEDPPGFRADRLAATRVALLRKRGEEVSRAWPELRAAFGASWTSLFAEWAAGRAPSGALREGWIIARENSAMLPEPALVELAVRECTLRFDGDGVPQPRRAPAIRLVAGTLVIQFGGRVRVWNREARAAV